ncbi:MAG: 50S ribosomal protein L11 methyltransferase [Rhodospirillaceae bacterium]|nr:50S ribosomal protein L11 methyltransferase [Rhodospirillaceae bacterium]MBT3932118.1 50S ribosomal protein L11 methyltransferase [Rhodospirillaceae bacterium]MBT4774004.1 50S ribosomal protein L11 methyltransferase [Rhodospirillaceae bacterium]MBT5358567.1 50S ribosomal protein L11 methyltransferase [Rhodospirillaceae bacterium]MBT5770891.1 50S ribosomal protein L11 methyltransferase [Rhodospirillaceae bacterium]
MAGNTAWKIELFVPSAAHDEFSDTLELFADVISLFPIEGTGETRISGYGSEAPDETALTAALADTARRLGTDVPTGDVVLLPDVDWVAENQASFAPVRAGRFYIHDSDHMDPPPAGTVPIRVDAATAFGTGHHGTTRGCLEALDRVIRSGVAAAPVLDLGCGTGILGIAAAKAMRARVIGSDIDPIAVAKARENVRVNGVSAFMRTYESRGLDAVMVRRHGPFGLVLANILARPLERLAPLIAAHRASGAPVILSGLLRTQEPQVIAAYRRAGLHLRARIHHDEWSTLICG